MISSEATAREMSDRGTAVSSAGLLESLEGLHAASEVAIVARKFLNSRSAADWLFPLECIPAGIV